MLTTFVKVIGFTLHKCDRSNGCDIYAACQILKPSTNKIENKKTKNKSKNERKIILNSMCSYDFCFLF